MNKPIWQPEHPETTRMWQFMQYVSQEQKQPLDQYQQLHDWSVKHPELFWPSLCEFFGLTFDTPPEVILNDYKEMMDARWFKGARFNFAQKLLSRRDDHPALICIDEANTKYLLSYKQLYEQVAQCAAGLQSLGIGVGDCVAAVLPNSHYAVIAMLASASLGATWSSCSPDFGAQAALDRLGQIDPKVLFICDGHQYHGKKYPGDEKIQQLVAAMPSLKQTVICPNINATPPKPTLPKVLLWNDFIKPASKCHFVSLPFDQPLYILFSSGTTGKPKCIMHGAGGTLLQHFKELGLHSNLKAQDTLCFYTTCGWMMWNWSISSLALGATLTLYEGSPTYPETGRLFKLIEQEGITVFGTSAKFLLSVEKAGLKPNKEYDLSALTRILSTGSPLLPKSYEFVYEDIKPDLQLSSISGGTDIVSCFALGNPILPVYKGELQCLGLGMAVSVVNEQGEPISGAQGELVCTKPFPSMPVGFWKDINKEAYRKAYFQRFPGIWAQGDFAQLTEHHGLIIYGRSDAVLNPGGVRIGTAEIYKLVEQVDAVIDSVVIGQDWEDDVRIVLFVQLRPGLKLDEALTKTIKQTIRQNASPRHVPAKIIQVEDIPRTMSGKTVELAVRQVVHGQEILNLQSLSNPKALDHFRDRAELKF
ncbi:MAG: acetoacetate--CoA ligase [Legionellales bacterium]